jgi:hypothetical protein
MSKNKLYNQSYFVKRILDAGYSVDRLNIKFESDDTRRWMILINSKRIKYHHNICVTCFKTKEEFSFKFQGQAIRDFILNTKSMNTIIEILNDVIGVREKEELEGNNE